MVSKEKHIRIGLFENFKGEDSIAGSVRCRSLDSHSIVFRPSDGQSHAIRNDNLQFTVAANAKKRIRNIE